jgi:branched-chain amino acid transport system substrate-binding protein
MVGAVVPLTGTSALWGRRTLAGLQLASELANDAGGIRALGSARLVCAVGDSHSRAENAARHAERLIARGAVALVGCNQSAASLVVSDVAEQTQIPFIIPTDLEPVITTRGVMFTFRLGPTLDAYAHDLLGYIRDLGATLSRPPRRVALLSESSVMGRIAGDGVRRAAGALGFEVVDTTFYNPALVNDFGAYVAGYRRAAVEVVIGHNSLEDAIRIAHAMSAAHFNPKACGGILGGQASPGYVSALGRLADNVLGTTGWWPNLDVPGQGTLQSRYRERAQEPIDAAAAAGISAIAVICDALERAGSTERRTLRAAIAATDLRPGERMLLQLRGVRFLPSGDNDRARGLVLVVKDGAPQLVAPREYAKATALYPKPPWAEGRKR